MRATFLSHLILYDLLIQIKFGDEYKLWRSCICNFFDPLSFHFPTLRSMHSTEHYALKHPQSVLFLYGERPSFIPTQKSKTASQLVQRDS
jgi:hypothetical protein